MKNKLIRIISSLLVIAIAFSMNLIQSSAENYVKVEDDGKGSITVIIDENANGDLTIDLGDFLGAAGSYSMPGDTYQGAKIKFVNNSKYTYQYKDESLEIGTSYLGTSTNKYGSLTGFKGYDDKPLVYGEVGYIAQSKALKALNNGKELTIEQMLNIKQILIDLNPKYDCKNPLTEYYYDYYGITSFDQLSRADKADMMGEFYNNTVSTVSFVSTYSSTAESKVRYNELNTSDNQYSVFYKNQLKQSGMKLTARFKYTEAPLAQFTYNYFYSTVTAITFDQEDYPLNSSSYKDYSFKAYSDKNSTAYTTANEIFSQLVLGAGESQADSFLDSTYFFIDGYNIGNAYQSYEISYGGEIVLEKVMTSGDITVNKTLDLNHFDTSDEPTFIFELTDVKGHKYYQSMSFKEGETKKSIQFKGIPLGEYTVKEVDTIRYEAVGSSVLSGVLTKEQPQQTISFVNRKEKDNDFSDTNIVINSFKKTDNGIEITQDYQGTQE